MKRLISQFIGLAACMAALLVPIRSSGYAFVYHFDIGGDPIFSGTPPAGPTSWVDALFEDVTPGTVLLTLSTVGLTSDEKLVEFYINLNPSFDPTTLSFTSVGTSGGFSLPTIDQGLNAYKADGDGKYDVRFNFATPPVDAFTTGEYVTYQISGIPGLEAADFIFLSQPAGGHGPFFAAGHVQSIGAGGDSGWIAPTTFSEIPIPEPASATILLLAGGLWLSRRAARKQRA